MLTADIADKIKTPKSSSNIETLLSQCLSGITSLIKSFPLSAACPVGGLGGCKIKYLGAEEGLEIFILPINTRNIFTQRASVTLNLV